MARYFAVLDGEAGAFGVSFPDCPGCVAMGIDENEAYANAIAALGEWAQDAETLSPPRPIADLRRDPDVAATLGEGGAFIALPFAIESGRTAPWRSGGGMLGRTPLTSA